MLLFFFVVVFILVFSFLGFWDSWRGEVFVLFRFFWIRGRGLGGFVLGFSGFGGVSGKGVEMFYLWGFSFVGGKDFVI